MRNKKIYLFFLIFCISLVIIGLIKINYADDLDLTILDEIVENNGEYDSQKIVLNNTTKEEAKSIAERLNAKLRITKGGTFATLTLPSDVSVYDVCMDNENLDIIEKFSLDYQAKTSDFHNYHSSKTLTNDPYFEQQTYLNYLNLDSVWKTTTGNGVKIAIIDTGIDTDHIEFKDQISKYSYNASLDKVVKDYVLNDGSYDWSLIDDEQGHGTSVAGVVGAKMNNNVGIAGIAPNAELLIIKVESDQYGNFYSTSDLVFGLYYAIECEADVVNMSFTSSTNLFASATKLAKDNDVICVAAAGNDGMPEIGYPALDENVIAVGALDSDSYKLAEYSNYGDNLDIVAPGTVYTTSNDGLYRTISGTSFASPIVASVIALYLSQNKNQELCDVKEILYASAKDLGDAGPDFYYGYGAIDAKSLILDEKGTITFNYLTNEIDETYQIFVKNHTLQNLPKPSRLYAIFDGWYYDSECSEPLLAYQDIFTKDLTLYAKWVNDDDGVPFTYQVLSDNTIEITGYKGRRNYITIPNIIDGMEVSSIGSNAFKDEINLKIITLPTTLKFIKNNAFLNCVSLSKLEIPKQVTTIGEYAFSGCTNLAQITFEENANLTSIGNFAFQNNIKLVTLNLPKKLETFNGSCILGTTKLKSITIASSNKAFRSIDGVLYNNNLNTLVAYPINKDTNYEINNKTKTIGMYAFGYSKLTKINLNNVETINYGAFINSSLESIDLSGVLNTNGYTFKNAYALKEVTFGNKLSNISVEMFSNCTNLKQVTIPNSVKQIDESAFAASGLNEVTFAADSKLQIIGNSAFSNTSIKQIAIPQSVVYIGNDAFASCNSLTNVDFQLNSNLTYIGDNAFCKTRIAKIDFPNHLTYIGSYAFKNTLLTTVSIPYSVLGLGDGVFADCSKLKEIIINDLNDKYTSIDGVVYNKEKTTLITYPSAKKDNQYYVLDTVKVIANAAFYGTRNLETIILNDCLESIGDEAFAYAMSLNQITIPDNVINIGKYSFANTSSLTITFSNDSKLSKISSMAFAYAGITSFNIPSSVSMIEQGAFTECHNLKTVTFNGNSQLTTITSYMFDGCTKLNSITFEKGSKLSTIAAYGLDGLSNLKSIDFGNAIITKIDNFAFRFCNKLTNLTFNEGLSYIGRYAFYGCDSITSFQMPSTLEYIGRYAFYECNDLELYFVSDTLPINTQDYWDHSIKGYYLGVNNVITTDEFKYAVLDNNDISIIEYIGNESTVDLSNIELGGNIITIGTNAFKYKEINKVILPNTVKTIASNAFYCSSIKTINFVDSIEYIGSNAFFNTNLRTVEFGKNSKLKKIDHNAFAYCDDLITVSLPKTLTNLGEYSFYQSGVINLTLAKAMPLETIAKYAFEFTHINKVTLPNNVTKVDDNAFANIKELESIIFNQKELSLMTNAFYNTGIKELTIPANIIYIGDYSLISLINLSEYKVSENNQYYQAIDGVLFSKDGKKLIAYPAGKQGTYALPSIVETIGFGAFENSKIIGIDFSQNHLLSTIGNRAFFKCNNLETITIPSNVVSIDYYAFAYCNNLKEVEFEENSKLYGIYEGAFYSCKHLSKITVPDKVVELGDYSFYGCLNLTTIPVNTTSNLISIASRALSNTGIKTITLPDNLISIGDYAFSGSKVETADLTNQKQEELHLGIGIFEDCVKLETMTLPFLGSYFDDNETNWFGYIFGAGNYRANSTYVPESLKEVTIIEGITSIYSYTFYDLANLERVNLPHSVTKIYQLAFENTTFRYKLTNNITFAYMHEKEERIITSLNSAYIGKGIEEIHIGNSIAWIDTETFSNCSNITSIMFEKGSQIKIIYERTFMECNNLTNFEIPDSVTNIESNAFYRCYSMTNVYYQGTIEDWCNITFSDKYSNPMFYAKYIYMKDSNNEYREVTEIEIPDTITSISDCRFYNFTALKSITISSSITYIGLSAFKNCSSLTNVVFGEGSILTSIGSEAFYNCNSLTSIEIPSSVTSIDINSFSECRNLTLVINNSDLELSIGSTDFGYVAYYAYKIINKDESITYIDNDEYTYIETVDDFLFRYDANNNYALVAYLGTKDIVTLPIDINGNNYDIKSFKGACSLIIPKNFANIGNCLFTIYWQLTNIYYEGTIEDWCNITFSSCSSNPMSSAKHFYMKDNNNEYMEVTEIIIPDNVTSIGAYQFYGFSSLKSITLSSSVTSIGSYAFYSCSRLTSIEIPEGVTSIGSYAFYSCTRLTSIEIPEGVTSIGSYAFYSCSRLASIEIPLGITSIEDSTFKYCSSLTSIVLPLGLTSIGENAFSYSSLTSIVIPFGVINIGTNALYNCSLTSIELPSSLKNISSPLISGWRTKLENVYYDGTIEDWCNIIFSTAASNPMCYAKHFYMKDNNNEYKEVTEIIIPDTITSIGNYQFCGFSSLKSITLPSSITSIGSYAFYSCSRLTSIEIPLGIISIEDSTFKSCSSLTSIELPSSVTSIGESAFYNCSSLTSIELPSSVTSIGKSAFSGCNNLTNVYYNGTIENWCNIIFSTGSSNPMYYATHFYMKDSNNEYQEVREIEIPDTITSIGNYQFQNFSSLKSITLPSSVTSIGSSAFYGCINLLTITNNSHLNLTIGSADYGYIAYYADELIDRNGNITYKDKDEEQNIIYQDFLFKLSNNKYTLLEYLGTLDTVTLPSDINGNSYEISNIKGVKNVIIPDAFTSIGQYAFYNCSSLTSIELPSSVTSIGNGAFIKCSSLTSIELPSSVTSIGNGAFFDCRSLTKVYYNGTIEDWCNITFSNLSSNPMYYAKHFYMKDSNNEYKEVTELVIQDTITSIGNYQFYGFSNLISIKLHSNITSIVLDAFSGCNGLTNVYYEGTIEDWCNIKFSYSNPMEYATHFYMKDSNNQYKEVTEIVIPNTITSIGEYQFYGFSSLKSITLPSSVTSIGSSAFDNCSNLTSIELPSSVTSIGSFAFSHCSNLTSIELPSSVTRIEQYAFSGCSSLTLIINNSDLELTIGSTDNGYITYYAYKIINKDGSITYKDNDEYTYIETVDDFLFRYDANNNYELVAYLGTKDEIALPSDINGKFYELFELNKDIIFNDVIINFRIHSFDNYSRITSIVIPEGITNFDSDVLKYCNNLTKIIISKDVKYIGSSVFEKCNNLTNVYYEGTIEDWYNITFNNRYSNPMGPDYYTGGSYISGYIKHFYMKDSNNEYKEVTEIVIPETITSIGNYQFYGFSSLKSITLSSSITSIGESAFSNCSSLTNVYYNGTIEDWCNITFSSYDSNPMFNAQHFFIKDSNNEYREVTEIVIPETIISIGKYQFCGFSSLKSVTLPSSATNIRTDAFSGCSSLTSIELPSSITSIGESAFSGCSSLTSIKLPSSVTSIGSSAFSFCSSLTNVYYEGTIEDWCNITFSNYESNSMFNAQHFFIKDSNNEYREVTEIVVPDTITSIGAYQFYNFTALKSITIPSSVTSIGRYAFQGCSSLTSIIFGKESELTSIGDYAFYNCSSLTSIEIPEGVIDIGSHAFYDCKKLISIVLPDSITKIYSDAFTNTAYCLDLSNYVNGCLFIGNHLINTNSSAKYIIIPENGIIAEGALVNANYVLKQINLKDNEFILYDTTNIETIYVDEIPNDDIFIKLNIINYYGIYDSVTLKNIVLGPNVKLNNLNKDLFAGVSGINIYVSSSKVDTQWDENFPNWNNGNTVYYGDEWIRVDFYDNVDNLVSSEIYLTSQVIRVPIINSSNDEHYNYEIIGWDIDGDGLVDSIPATSNNDITAKPVIEKTERLYTVRFMDGEKVLYIYYLPYGTEISVPDDPVKKGYIFNGWSNFVDGMTVSSDFDIIGEFTHIGDHNCSITVVVEPTCSEEGYTKHICPICDECEKDNYVPALGHKYQETIVDATCEDKGYTLYTCLRCDHSYKGHYEEKLAHIFGEWIIEQEETCSDEGSKYHICINCNYQETVMIPPHDHSFYESIIKEPTCSEEGIKYFICEECGYEDSVKIDKLEHNYEKTYVSKSWIEWLIEIILNIIFGFEGDQAYYYKCTNCGHIKTTEDNAANKAFSSSISSTECSHTLGEWYVAKESECMTIEFKDCTKCHQHIEIKSTEGLGHIESDWIIYLNATCSKEGVKHTECTRCHETLKTTIIQKIDHNLTHYDGLDATCTEKGYEAYDVCENCDYTTYKEIAALGHNESDWIIDNEDYKHTECTRCHTPLKEIPIVTITMTNGASIRLDSPAGLRFEATVSKLLTGVKFGMVFANGKVDADQLIVGATGTVYAEVDELKDNLTYAVSMVGIPKRAYLSAITARAYILVNGIYIYSDEVVTRNIYEVAKAYQNAHPDANVEFIDEILSICDENQIIYQLNGGYLDDIDIITNNLKNLNELTSISTNANSKYWSNAKESIFLFSQSNLTNTSFSHRIELTLRSDGLYEVTQVATFGEAYSPSDDYSYVILISPSYVNYDNLSDFISKAVVGTIAVIDGTPENGIADIKFYDESMIKSAKVINSVITISYPYTLTTKVKKDGYVFAGWYDNSSFNGEALTTVTSSTVLYAKWEKVEEVTDNA